MPNSLPRFDLEAPETIRSAVEIRNEIFASMFIAGGTDILPGLRLGASAPELVISLKRIRDWPERRHPDLWIRPDLPVARVRGLLPRDEAFAGLLAATTFSSPLVEPLATVGGNLAAARSDSSLLAPLIALRAWVAYESITGPGTMAVNELVDKPGHTNLPAGALLTGICVPEPGAHARAGSRSIRSSAATATPAVTVTAVVEVGPGGRLVGGRLAVAHASPVAHEVIAARELLGTGRHWRDVADDLAEAAADESQPETDRWASDRYRLRMTRVATQQLLRELMERQAP